jgi:hypothetical protein
LAAAFTEIRHTLYDPVHRVPSLHNKKAGGLMNILRLPLTSPNPCAYYLVFLTNALYIGPEVACSSSSPMR